MDKSASLVRMRSCPGKRLTLSSRTSDRRHWCGVCPAGTIRSPRPALARALPARSRWAVFVCISFPSRGSGKRNQGVRQCLHWLMKLPPAASDMIPLKGLGASKERASPIFMRRRESARPSKQKQPPLLGWLFCLELLGRFELPTSSLPIHFRLSRLDFACLRLSPESRINTRFSDSACPLLT